VPGPRAGLPVELTSFIGRERELATTRALLRNSRCVTLTGVGGSGKTRLALELASDLEAEFRDGVVFVDLAPISDPDLVVKATLESIGLVESARRSVVEAILIALRHAHLLLVLDNCEHVVAACAALVERLLKACPDLRVLATSRQPLEIPGEVAFALPPLSIPEPGVHVPHSELTAFEALQLFAARAMSVRPGFTIDEANVESVAAICTRLDGLPLAIELAAARARSLATSEIQQRLDDSFTLLSRGPRTASPRHQTLRAAIDWSHDLLAEPEQIFFRRLAVFRGGWTLDDAQHVCSSQPLGGSVLNIQEGLVEKSLVVAELSHPAPTRYRYLETIREYACERLLASGEQEVMQRRHFSTFLDKAERYYDERVLKGSDAGLPALARERENLRAALTWGVVAEPEGALRMTGALDDFWHMVNPAEGWQWLQRTLQAVGRDSPHRARGLLVAGKLAGYVRAYAEGAGLLREAKAMSEVSGDRLMEAAAELWLGRLAIFAGDLESAEDRLGEALTKLEALDNPLGRVRSLALLGLLQAVILGRRSEGERKLTAAADLARAIGDSWGDGYVHMMLSIYAADIRDAGSVQEHASRALDTPSIAPLHGVPLQQIARVVVEEDPGRSLRLLGAASGMLERDGTDEPAFLAQRAVTARQRAEQLVGSATAMRLFDEGRTMGLAEVRELASLGPTEQARQRPGGLTQRELQVAGLVGLQRTNRDIARTLFISVRTAESHIEHILAKLRLSNRNELAAWARGNDLVLEAPAKIR
jgi:predicted ATPase/DNA-binding CsgD family transcriptional regulator